MTPNRSSCRQSSPSKYLVLSGVGRSTKRASVSCHLLSSNNHTTTTTTVRPRAPPRLPHPPICRNLNGLWASSNSCSNYGSKVPLLCPPSPRRQTKACLCLGSTCLRFLKRRPRARIKILAPSTPVSVLYHSLVHLPSPRPRPRVPASIYPPPLCSSVVTLYDQPATHHALPIWYILGFQSTNRQLRFSVWTV